MFAGDRVGAAWEGKSLPELTHLTIGAGKKIAS
jgi:hypothetical protein